MTRSTPVGPSASGPTAPGASVQPGFIGNLKNRFTKGLKSSYIGSQGYTDMGNAALEGATGGSVQLQPGNKLTFDAGKAISHFGGQAMDWLKNNPGKAMLGGGALLGGGMLLHNALSGGSEEQSGQPQQEMQQPQQPQRRFAFDKPGITG